MPPEYRSAHGAFFQVARRQTLNRPQMVSDSLEPIMLPTIVKHKTSAKMFRKVIACLVAWQKSIKLNRCAKLIKKNAKRQMK